MLFVVLPSFFVELDGILDVVAEFLGAEGFFQEVESAGAHGFHRHANVAVAGDYDDRQVVAARDEFLLQLQPLIPGILMSSTRHAGPWGLYSSRKSSAEL